MNLDTDADAPDFIWECSYPDLDSRKVDAAWVENSEEFKEVEDQMATLLVRFERHVFRLADGDED